MSNEGEVLQKQIFITLLGAESPFERGLRWSQIRDHLLRFYPEEEKIQAFSMRVSRALRQLVKNGVVARDNQGHRRTFYKVVEEGVQDNIKQFIPRVAKNDFLMGFILNNPLEKTIEDYSKILMQSMIGHPGGIPFPSKMSYEEFEKVMFEKIHEVMKPHIQEYWNSFTSTYNKLRAPITSPSSL